MSTITSAISQSGAVICLANVCNYIGRRGGGGTFVHKCMLRNHSCYVLCAGLSRDIAQISLKIFTPLKGVRKHHSSKQYVKGILWLRGGGEKLRTHSSRGGCLVFGVWRLVGFAFSPTDRFEVRVLSRC